MASFSSHRARALDASLDSSFSSAYSAPEHPVSHSYYGSHSASLSPDRGLVPPRQSLSALYLSRPAAARETQGRYASPFAVRDVSPSQRRKLVSELRMDAHRTRSKVLARQLEDSRGGGYGEEFSARILDASRFSARVVADAPSRVYISRPMHRYTARETVLSSGFNPEDEVQRSLAELDRSTERLRLMGSELVSFAESLRRDVSPKANASNGDISPVLPRANTAAATTAAAAAAAVMLDSRTVDFSNISTTSVASSETPRAPPAVAAAVATPAAVAEAKPAAPASAHAAPSIQRPEEELPAPPPVAAVPPAHVGLSDIEEERARRKREFLAKRQASESSSASEAPPIVLASEPLPEMVEDERERRRREFREKRAIAELSGPILFTSRTVSAPAAVSTPAAGMEESPRAGQEFDDSAMESDDSPAHRAKVAAAPAAPPTVKRSIVFDDAAPKAASSAAATAAAPAGEEDDVEEDRAAKFERMALQAAMLQAGGKSFAVVPFGTFLQEQVGKHSSYDDGDLARGVSMRQQRPPPLLPSDMRRTKVRRASSMDQIYTMKDGAADGSKPAAVLKKQPVLLEGFLYKSSGAKMFSGIKWRRRWFVLSGRLLVYTASPKSNEVGRLFDLNHIEVITDPKKLGKTFTPHAIGIQDHARRITLCADSHAEILKWYQAIVLNVALLCVESRERPITSLPPKDRSQVSAIEAWRKEMIAKHKANLPVPPAPLDTWFYPHYQPPPSHYDVLGVPSDSSASAIKKAYFRLARESHPDRNPDVTQEDFSKISFAYDMLIDPAKRANYDLSERIKENLRQGIDLWMHVPVWDDADLAQEPRLRPFRRAQRKRMTVFSDGDLHILYWQDAPEDVNAPPLPLRPSADRCIELRFVQQVLYARDHPELVEMFGPVSYEEENKLVLLGDRLITGPLVLEMASPLECKDLITGLRVSRCERSALFSQKLESLQKSGLQ